MKQFLGYLGLAVFVLWAIGVIWLAWEQASKADAMPENDAAVRRRMRRAS